MLQKAYNEKNQCFRLYFLYVPEENGEIGFRKYFLTETSSKGKKLIHINEQGEEWLGEVLDDSQNERNVLCECYTAILIREQMGLSEGREWKQITAVQ